MTFIKFWISKSIAEVIIFLVVLLIVCAFIYWISK